MADRDRHERAGLRRGSRARLRFAADNRLVALVRRGDPTAFEILYDRHAGELLSFCGHLLGSRADAEDAIQSTFASAHRALLADDRAVDVRPWLFTIARNACLSILRARRPAAEVPAQAPRGEEDPVVRAEQREDMRQLLTTLGELPERQRVALVLRELHGFNHSEIAAVLGVRAEQVKSYVYQARSNLISERDAREADCGAVRQELANARGPALLKSQLRRHLRSCADCRAYAAELARQRRRLGILLPLTPSMALKHRALDAALGGAPHAGTHTGGAAGGAATAGAASGGAAAGGTATGASVAATGAELATGGAKALVAKLLVGVACLGAGSGAATLVAGIPATPARRLAATSQPRFLTSQPPSARPVAAPVPSKRSAAPGSAPAAGANVSGGSTAARHLASQPPATSVVQAPQSSHVDTQAGPAASSARATAVLASGSDEAHGKGSASEEPHGKSEEPHGGSEEPHGKSEEAHGNSEAGDEPHGKSSEAHGNGEEAHGKSEETHGNSEAVHGKSEETHGNSEAVHGKSEEAHGEGGSAEEPHGKSEQAHGKGGN
jgi:RNA polymerase sigma factor (sigma-70 family)